MTRFISQHEIKKQDQKLKQDNLVDSTKYKHELKDAINKEYHRINVDSAKKKAVVQRMDYDNFHQMVLGADIKGMKPEDIVYVKFDRTEKVLNSCSVKDKLTKGVDVLDGIFVNDDIQNNIQLKYNFSSNMSNREKALKFKTEYNKIPEENQEERLIVLSEINESISLETFILEISLIDPVMFSSLLITLIYLYYLENIDTIDKKTILDKGFKSLSELTNLSKLKMFLKKDVKSILSDILSQVTDSSMTHSLAALIN